MTGGGPDPRERAWSWVAHLRAGGTTPWSDWERDGADGADGADEADRADQGAAAPWPYAVLPGAQQLELLRRVNQVAAVSRDVADRVLAASALDRGRSDLPLPGGPRREFGPRPLDPAEVPVEELLRVAVLLVADALPGAPGPPESPGDGSTSAARPGRLARLGARLHRELRGYRVVGDPWVAAHLRADLRRRGRPQGGRRPRVLVVAAPLPVLLARTWAHQVLTTGAAPWPEWVAAHAGGRLPRGADVAGQARTWAARARPGRVVVVTDLAAVGRLVGVPRLDLGPSADPVPGLVTGLGGDAVELARRVRLALAVVAPPHEHEALLRERLEPALAAVDDGRLPAVPEQHRRWVRRRAVRQHRRLRRAGYPVAGDVDVLLAHGDDAATDGPDPERVLALAVTLLTRGLAGAQDDPAPEPGEGRAG